jgi:hypothetical protein
MKPSFALALLVALSVAACSDDVTSGKKVVLATDVSVAPASATGGKGGAAFLNDAGWQVSLDKVAVAGAALNYYSGPPLLALHRAKPTLFERLAGVLEGTAYAHPGHYTEGDNVGEMLAPFDAEFAKATVKLPNGAGITGTFRSARFTFDATRTLGGHPGATVYLAGTATKDGVTRPFTATATQAEVVDVENLPRVEGCSFTPAGGISDGVAVTENGTIHLQVAPILWLSDVDFTDAASGTEPAELPAESRARRAFVRNLKGAAAFQFSYEKSSTATP